MVNFEVCFRHGRSESKRKLPQICFYILYLVRHVCISIFEYVYVEIVFSSFVLEDISLSGL